MRRILSTIAILSASLTLATAQVAKPMEDVNHVVDLTADSLGKAQTARIPAGTSRKGNNPVLFLVGNSTMRNGTLGNGNNGQWGWGFFEHAFFNEDKITVENQALGGMSSRTFYNRLWPDVRKAIRPGDWVIISIGHNDNGPYDSGRARASIPGVGHDSLQVVIKETGVHETVYTYGEYMRRFIHETRAAGGNPILMSLTPRDSYGKDGKIERKIHTQWLMQVAQEENVPFVDLNEISGAKLDKYGHWKEKYMFYMDHIHSSRFGAMMNARSAAEGIAESKDPKLAPLQAMMNSVALPTETFTREKGKPVVFITGDSTVKNEDKNKDGMWGWGSQAYTVFNNKKITCVNAAKAGRSTRTYLNEGRWDRVYNSLQPGDFVLIQFGHNDIGGIDKDKERGVIASADDTCHVYKSALTGQYELVYSFGWYLKKFIQDVREKGATPILVSLTPRNEWTNGKIERRNDTYGKWYRQVAAETGVDFLDLHNITADYLDKKCGSKEKASEYFNHDHTHSSLKGAQMNAKNIAKGLKNIHSQLAKYLK
jgi:lysophospholipase L1-like esterase